ncbi:MAG: hypothetical protein LM583_10310 [Desulfurococcaceae archaeon]|nr:hypothetical protein [Desulfurococcaceae archaeon]
MIIDYAISFPADAHVVVVLGDAKLSLRQLASKVSCNKSWCTFYFTELDVLELRRDKCKIVVHKPNATIYEMTCKDFVKYIEWLNGEEI